LVPNLECTLFPQSRWNQEDAVINLRHFCVLAAVLTLPDAAGAQTAKMNSVLDMADYSRLADLQAVTIDVANAMPAELYDFKPNPGEMTFGEQMIPGSNRLSPSIWRNRPFPTSRTS
jgi:hypothetical protein